MGVYVLVNFNNTNILDHVTSIDILIGIHFLRASHFSNES